MKHGLVFKTDANRVVLARGENLYKIDRRDQG
jgi:hypothetical protein